MERLLTAGGLQEHIFQEAGAEDSQLWGLHLTLLPLSLQGQEPSGGTGLGGLKTR